MLVNDKHLTTIWYEEKIDKVKIIDQRLIPFELKIIELNTVDEVCFAIKEMQVRGAPLIGVTAAFGMYLASKENSNLDFLQEASNFNMANPGEFLKILLCHEFNFNSLNCRKNNPGYDYHHSKCNFK